MADRDSLALARARGKRWLPARPIGSLEQAGRFIDDVGFALLFPADRPMMPSLWEAVAGADTVPFADGMGAAESMLWTWKDTLPEAGLAWSGKFLHQRASLLSPRLLAALYSGAGEPDDHRSFAVDPDAHRVADALLPGPQPSSALRAIVGNSRHYERAIRQLQRLLLVTSAGVRQQRTGWPAVVMDLTCRRFDVHARPDHLYAAARFLDTMIEAAPEELARAFGWPTAAARARMDELVTSGQATQSSGRYRDTQPPHP